MTRRRQPSLVRDALAYLAAHGLVAVADASGKHKKVRWTTSDGRERALTLPEKPYGSANAQSLARLRQALEGASQ
jgi:DNA-binding FadR family transcriptional regulator